MRTFTLKGLFLATVFMVLGCVAIHAADDDLITRQITIKLEKAGTLPCGDCDWLGCIANNWMDVAEYLRDKLDVFGLGGFDMKYCINFFNQCCSALGGDNEIFIIPEEEND